MAAGARLGPRLLSQLVPVTSDQREGSAQDATSAGLQNKGARAGIAQPSSPSLAFTPPRSPTPSSPSMVALGGAPVPTGPAQAAKPAVQVLGPPHTSLPAQPISCTLSPEPAPTVSGRCGTVVQETFPTSVSLRQVLEHRKADCRVRTQRMAGLGSHFILSMSSMHSCAHVPPMHLCTSLSKCMPFEFTRPCMRLTQAAATPFTALPTPLTLPPPGSAQRYSCVESGGGGSTCSSGMPPTREDDTGE